MAACRVMVVMNALHSGGAESTCIELARSLSGEHEIEVASLSEGGPAEEQLRELGIKTHTLGGGTARRPLGTWLKLRELLKKRSPEAVITFLYLADLLGGAGARLYAPRARVYWNVRNNVLARTQTGRLTYLASRANARLSNLIPHQIVYCSRIARVQHEALGYRADVGAVVENSVQSVAFGFSARKRGEFRQNALGDDFVFLFVGRFDPVKRVDLYLQAARALCRSGRHRVRFLIAGRGMEPGNVRLRELLTSSGVSDCVQLLGYVSDPQLLYSAADCLIVTSESEGSPNVIYEAIATQLPVIILGTVGTENLGGGGVTRLAGRDISLLTQAMDARVAGGALPASVRAAGAARPLATAEHPLVVHYRQTLAGAVAGAPRRE